MVVTGVYGYPSKLMKQLTWILIGCMNLHYKMDVVTRGQISHIPFQLVPAVPAVPAPLPDETTLAYLDA